MGRLTEDPAFLATTFVVIDFEATTPTGYPAQPIEVAALALRHRGGAWTEAGRSTSLIRPPDFAPVTPDVTAQNGLTPHLLRDAPHPAQAFATLDQRFTPGTPYLLVAQHAATEANIIYNQREHCPRLARVDLLDTIPLAKLLIPGLPNYKLDTLLAHFGIMHPLDRHRATADVDVTAQVFRHLIALADENTRPGDLASLMKRAGRTARCNIPVQDELFGANLETEDA
ncbi:3'-5' exonuclease [Kineosporia rhizophila]|uniref:3'-5' exonuclease n=1 Tax=Kineosporia rhizophila TaxID=84633 RepID=UPI000ADFDC74|nr:3'-5' exonuclease [Kineosporia rhizophila]MCE0536041.1 3'-5' exonuclease [Kineosporia rhizophila]